MIKDILKFWFSSPHMHKDLFRTLSNIWDGAFLRKIVNRLQPWTIFFKKLHLRCWFWMRLWHKLLTSKDFSEVQFKILTLHILAKFYFLWTSFIFDYCKTNAYFQILVSKFDEDQAPNILLLRPVQYVRWYDVTEQIFIFIDGWFLLPLGQWQLVASIAFPLEKVYAIHGFYFKTICRNFQYVF